jgi:hypothetical protein
MSTQPEPPSESMNGTDPNSPSPSGPEPLWIQISHYTPILGQFLGFGSFIYELLTNSQNEQLIIGSVGFGLGSKILEEIRDRLKK